MLTPERKKLEFTAALAEVTRIESCPRFTSLVVAVKLMLVNVINQPAIADSPAAFCASNAVAALSYAKGTEDPSTGRSVLMG